MAGVSYQHWQWYDAPELSGLILGYILTLLLSAQRRGKGLPVLGNSSAVWITSLTPAGFQQTGKQPILCGPEILWQRWWKAQSCPEWEHDHTRAHSLQTSLWHWDPLSAQQGRWAGAAFLLKNTRISTQTENVSIMVPSSPLDHARVSKCSKWPQS